MRPILPFVLLLLGACGFHPRGEIVLPAALERASLEVADPFSPVARDLRDALLRAGVVLVPPGTEGAGALRLPVNQAVRDTLAVNETRAFAHNLFNRGQAAQCAPLTTYAAALTTYADAYAIGQMERQLAAFPKLVESIETAAAPAEPQLV